MFDTLSRNPIAIYLLKVNNRNTRERREMCSKLTIKTPERRHRRRSGVFIVNSEHISHLVLASFEYVIASWEKAFYQVIPFSYHL